LLRHAGADRCLQLCLALSDEVLDLAWTALRDADPNATEDDLKTRFVAIHYGQDLAGRFAHFLAGRQR
jgi:hypothetical protein